MLQHSFEASGSGACTAMCWRPHTGALPPMILLGTQHGAKVNNLSPCLRQWYIHAHVRPMTQHDSLFMQQVYSYDSKHRSWEMAAHFAEATITDVAWATPAAGQAPEYVATASRNTASVWKLAGPADRLQVWHARQQCSSGGNSPLVVDVSTECAQKHCTNHVYLWASGQMRVDHCMYCDIVVLALGLHSCAGVFAN